MIALQDKMNYSWMNTKISHADKQSAGLKENF